MEGTMGRPSARRFGIIDCMGIVTVATGIELSFWVHAVITSLPGVDRADQLRKFLPQRIIEQSPPAIAVGSAWAALAFDGRWRADPSWLDRLGRILECIGWVTRSGSRSCCG
jgi:hypothetical protein